MPAVMNSRWFIGLGVAALLAAAWSGRAQVRSMPSDGETVSYAVWNARTDIELRAVSLVDERGENLFGGPYSSHPPGVPGTPGWTFGGSFIPADLKHRVPDVVRVSWRLPSRGPEGRGELAGPVAVKLRSRIPDDVLHRVRGSRRYYLEIGVTAGVQPVSVRWRLVDGKPPTGFGPAEVRRGGDW